MGNGPNATPIMNGRMPRSLHGQQSETYPGPLGHIEGNHWRGENRFCSRFTRLGSAKPDPVSKRNYLGLVYVLRSRPGGCQAHLL